MTAFSQFDLDPALHSAVAELGFETATPIQAETIPAMLSGRDVIAQARTGSGKTAAFGLPMLEGIKQGGKAVRALVLCPTRELALQVSDAIRSFATGLPVRGLAVYGGAPYPPQLRALKEGATVVVGTPGRVIDHIERGTLKLNQVELLVLDEADEMLRMGFLEAVETILEALPEQRQVALFSATMPAPIAKVAKRFLVDPINIKVESEALSVDHIEQCWVRVRQHRKLDVLQRILAVDPHEATLIFTRTRRGCAEIADGLSAAGVPADAIHGDLNQRARERVLNKLRARRISVLVATDVAARGLDVSHLTRVINYDYPSDSETYVHRIGRTGRAGKKGVAVTLVTPTEQRKLRYLERAINYELEEKKPPTLEQIARLQRQDLWAELEATSTASDLAELKGWLEHAQQGSQLDAVQIATAAVKLLCRQRGIDLYPPPEPSKPPARSKSGPGRPASMAAAEPSAPAKKQLNKDPIPHQSGRPEWRKGRAEGSRKSRGERPQTPGELFMSIGRDAGVRPADIVGALANEVGISGQDIGRISLFSNKVFIGLPGELIDKAIADFPTLTIRGRHVHLSRAWPRDLDEQKGPSFKRSPYSSKARGKSKGRSKSKQAGKVRGGKGYLQRRKGFK